MNIRTENWCGNEIRFVELDGEWWAILKDICDALKLRVDKVSDRLGIDMMQRIKIEVSDNPLKVDRSRGENKTRWMIVINELGIYETLFSSKKLEARKLRRWTTTVLRRLRKEVGLQGYEVMRMTDQSVQEDIDHFLDNLFYDDKTGMLMESVTVAGGDVEQVPYDVSGLDGDIL